MERPMIELKNVSKWYGAVQVLHDCSTAFRKGEVWCSAGRRAAANRR